MPRACHQVPCGRRPPNWIACYHVKHQQSCVFPVWPLQDRKGNWFWRKSSRPGLSATVGPHSALSLLVLLMPQRSRCGESKVAASSPLFPDFRELSAATFCPVQACSLNVPSRDSLSGNPSQARTALSLRATGRPFILGEEPDVRERRGSPGQASLHLVPPANLWSNPESEPSPGGSVPLSDPRSQGVG